MNEIEVKNCPFCGMPGILNRPTMFVSCNGKDKACVMHDRWIAIERWNGRPIEDRLNEEADGFMDTIKMLIDDNYKVHKVKGALIELSNSQLNDIRAFEDYKHYSHFPREADVYYQKFLEGAKRKKLAIDKCKQLGINGLDILGE